MSARTFPLRSAVLARCAAAVALSVCATTGAALASCSSRSDGATSSRSAAAPGSYDVIVVGSGAGGGPLAARLAVAGKRVLLLEAGGDVGKDLDYQVPARHAFASEDPARAWSYFVQHHLDAGDDQLDSKYVPSEGGVLYPRGSALGGSTAVNAMVTVLPPPEDWDTLASLVGDPSFRAGAMSAMYAKVQEWLPTELPQSTLALGDPIVTGFLTSAATVDAQLENADTATALAQLAGPSVNETMIDGETTGFFRLPLATSGGRRQGSRERVLDVVAQGDPLTLQLHSLVTKVLFDTTVSPPRATGVEYHQGSDLYAASAHHVPGAFTAAQQVFAGEVVLSAGTFNTPALLQLSGVGDAAALGKLGITAIADRPGVGKNLEDRYEAGIVAELDEPLPILAPCKLALEVDPTDPCMDQWNAGQGVYTTPGFLATMLVRTQPALPQADLQIFAVPTDARGYYPGYSKDSAAAKNRFSWLLLKAHAQNRSGFVAISGTDPSARPHIQMNVFEGDGGDADLAAMVAGIRIVRQVHAELRKERPDLTFREIWPGTDKQSDADLGQWVKDETWGHHACCTSSMGPASDPAAVVDAHFRVLGTQNLRVVDASVFPVIPGTFIALPLYMMAEKAAATMLEDLP